MTEQAASVLTKKTLIEAVGFSFRRLTPKYQARNPVMFVVYVVRSILTTILFFVKSGPCAGRAVLVHRLGRVLAVVHGAVRQFRRSDCRRPWPGAGRTLKKSRRDVPAKKLADAKKRATLYETVSRAHVLRRDDIVLAAAGDFMPGDGQVIDGIASVDESAITGESAPVIRESGGDRDAVTGGTRVLSDWVVDPHHRQPGRKLPRPDDRAGRGREAAEDAE